MLVNLKTDKVLDTFNLPKGSMSLVDAALQTEISKSVAGLPYSLSLGGSAGNTIRAMARLGCDVGFIGKVGTDKTGDFFIQALENLGIEPFIFRGKERSGRCVSLISPDGERTMVTFLGAALELSAAEVTPAIFEGYDCLYIEGYLVQDHDMILRAIELAKEAVADIFKENPGLNPTPEMILREVSRYYCTPVEKLKGSGRSKDLVLPRQVAMYLVRDLTDYSLPEIGKIFSRDHTTVLHSINKIENYLKETSEMDNIIKTLKTNIRG